MVVVFAGIKIMIMEKNGLAAIQKGIVMCIDKNKIV